MMEKEAPKTRENTSQTLSARGEVAHEQAGGQTEAATLTREELAAKLEQLSARARAAGMSPLQMMGQSYINRGLKVLDGFLSAMEEDAPKKPPAEAAPSKEKV